MRRDVGKIIASGSAKKRAQLLIEVMAQHRISRDMLISEDEFHRLEQSFKNTQELRIYNRYRQLSTLIPEAINVYQGAYTDALLKAESLAKLLLYWHGLEETEKLVNIALLEAAPEISQRRKILEKILRSEGLWYSRATADAEGLLQIDLSYWDEKHKVGSIKQLADTNRENLLHAVLRVVSWRKAILDVMEEEDFPVKAYEDIVNRQAANLQERVKFWGRYGAEEYFIRERLPRRSDLLEGLYCYEVEMESLEPSQTEYDYFRENFLTGKLDGQK